MTKSIGERITEFHHLTLPAKDLAVAERFYTEVLGAEVVRRMGTHFSIQFGGGPRIDIFQQTEMLSPAADHPKYAFTIAPDDLLEIASILDQHGVGYDGPVHQGPPGAAQIYLDDPSGNHLQLVCQGYTDWEALKVGYDRSKLRYDWPKDAAGAGPAGATAAPNAVATGPLISGSIVRAIDSGTHDIKTTEAVVPPDARIEILVNGKPICSYPNSGVQPRRQSLGEFHTLEQGDYITARIVHGQTGISQTLFVSIGMVREG